MRNQVHMTEDFENLLAYNLYNQTGYSNTEDRNNIKKMLKVGIDNMLTEKQRKCVIEQKNDLSDYFDDNPSKLYKFYYVRTNTLDNGYFAKGSVWIFEIRYEFDTASDGYKFKLFVESADSSHNGIYTNYYKMK